MAVEEKNIVKSLFENGRVEDGDMWKVLSSRMEKYATSVAAGVIDGISGISLTYNALFDEVENIAWNLQLHGFNNDNYLMIYMKTGIEYILITFAVWRLGGTVVCVNPLLTSDEISQKIQQVPCDIIVCDEFNAANAVKVGAKTNIKVISRFTNTSHPRCIPLATFRKKRTHNASLYKVCSRKTAMILFSSGTTGLPKAVEISHRSLVGQIRMWGGPEMNYLPKNCGVIYFPFSHIFGMTVMLIHMVMGCKVITMEQFNLERYLKLVSTYQVDKLLMVPPVALQLCKSNLIQKYDLACVRVIECGGAPLVKETENDLYRLFDHKLQIRQIFGTTEAVGGCIGTPVSTMHEFPPGCIGIPFPNVSAKVVDVTSGENLGPGKRGEICIKCEFIMTGYLNNPEATSKAIDNKGWLHTGDLGYYNNQGYFFIVDRIKELIKYKGYQVAPAELEGVLLLHPDIIDAGVTGVSDKLAGEVPHAWVVKKDGSLTTEHEIHQFVNGKVAPFKRIRGGIKFVKSIPKSPSGKLLRREIKRHLLTYSEKRNTSKL